MRVVITCLLTIAGLAFFPTMAYADTFTVSNTQDFSVQFFKIIFGDVASVMLGEPVVTDRPDTVMAEMMLQWNTFLHLVCLTVVIWNGGMWMVQSTMGRGESYDSFGLTFRFLIAIIGCVPLPHGYSLVQIFSFHGSAMGIQQANELADVIYDNMNAGGNVTQFGAQINSDKLVNKLFLSHVCMQLVNNYEGEQVIDRLNTGSTSADLGASDGIVFSEYNMSFGEDAWLGTYDEEECGSYTFSHLEGDDSYTNGVAEEALTESLFSAAMVLDTHIGTEVEIFIPKIWGASKVQRQSDDTGKVTVEYELVLTEITASLDAIRLEYKENVISALEQYEADRQEYVDENQEAIPSFTSNFNTKEIGWVALGATYILQSIQTQAGLQFVKSNTLKVRTGIASEVFQLEDIHSAMITSGKVVGEIIPGGENNVAQLDKLQNKTSSLIGNASLAFVEDGDDPIMSLMNYGHNLISIGEISLVMTIPFSALTQSMRAEIGEETTGFPLVGPGDFVRHALSLVETIVSKGVQSLLTMSYALIIAGIYFAFYIPALPLIHWIGAVLGAIIANVINIILSPVHVIAHALLEGHGVFGQHARQGYFIMFSAYLRFPLTVIGFAAVYPLLLGAGKLVILLYTPYVNSMVSGHVSGIVTFIALTALLGSIMSGVIERCNNIMHEITDSAMRMIGHSSEGMQGASLAGSASGRFTSDSTAVTQSALEGSKEGNRAKIRQEATQDTTNDSGGSNDLDDSL